MKIKLDIKMIFIVIIYLFTVNKNILLITIISMVLHELGHIITGILVGLKIKKIKLHISGFFMEFENYNSKRKNILVALSGPIANSSLIIAGIILQQEKIIYINIILLIINLLPIYPLDGGRVIKNTLLTKNKLKQANIKTENISKYTLILITIITSILILKYKNISIFILIIYLWGLFIKERQKNKIIRKTLKTAEDNS